MEARHWTKVRLNLRNIALTPLMYIGHSRYIKAPVSTGKRGIKFQSVLVEFDASFISYYIGEMLKKLIPLHPDKIEEILSESLEYYREEWNIYQAENGGDREPDDREKTTEVFYDE